MDRLNQLLGTEFPIIQGGMANIATGEFAAACSNAGALGVIASGSLRSAEELRGQIRICRADGQALRRQSDADESGGSGDGPGHFSEAGAGGDHPARAIRAPYIAAWKAAGGVPARFVAATVLARRLVQAGADAIIAEGTESGGHVGEMTTMALVPQVVDAVEVPVIAAGGIADGRQMAAALALGACGVQVGTCLLVSRGVSHS